MTSSAISRLPDGAAELVFQVLSERHERGSLIVTTNLPFGEWTKVFPDPRLAKAVVDRLTHRAHIIDTGTESWRFRHGLKRKRRTPDRLTRRGHAPRFLGFAGYAGSGSHIRQINQQQPTRRWGHFKPSRRGQRKPSFSATGGAAASRGLPRVRARRPRTADRSSPRVGLSAISPPGAAGSSEQIAAHGA